MNNTKVYSEKVKFKTYLTGAQDKHAIFLENRVYQGSSGAVYPYGVTDTLADKAEEREYNALYLENDFIKVMILPELGGRVHRAYDKVNKRDFVYYNHVIKPALVGLLGPWISGGIEFNWPQHHRPTTFMNVDYSIAENDDGSASIVVGEREPMHGLSVTTTFTLFKDKALLQISSKVYNTTDTPRSFLWWSNPAVKGGDGHQSVFPPDVTAVFDHGKRAVIDFPIAHGTYYKVNYDGVDISRYKNIPVPTSYMAWKSTYDFVGAYCHDEDGGLLHIADHNVSPGKKQWSWGYGEFGQAWDRQLTDSDGPYIELMTGVYTDNQPDFTWLDAGEQKTFVQNFLPYSKLGTVQNANTHAVVKLERHEGKIVVGAYAIEGLHSCALKVIEDDTQRELCSYEINLYPCHADTFSFADENFKRLKVLLVDKDGKEIISYKEHIKQDIPLPEIAKTPPFAKDINSTDEAFFIGQHLEQYHHATRRAIDYYKRALELDPLDYRSNVAVAQHLYNQCKYKEALVYLNHGLERALMLNRNPVCGQGSMLKGKCELKLGNTDEAYADFFRATWSGNTKSVAFSNAAMIKALQGDFVKAIELADNALTYNTGDQEALCIKAYALFESKSEDAIAFLQKALKDYSINAVLRYFDAHYNQSSKAQEAFATILDRREINFITISEFLLSVGRDDLLSALFKEHKPYGAIATLIYASLCEGDKRKALYQDAENEFNHFVRFPNLVFERDILATITDSAFAMTLCASFDYAHTNYDGAKALFEKALELDPHNVEALRGLGIYYFNKTEDKAKALSYYDKALDNCHGDERIIFEHDLIMKLCNKSVDERFAIIEKYDYKNFVRDDLKSEVVTLLNSKGAIDEAYELLTSRIFHVWEGGEGKVTNQFVLNAILRSVKEYDKGDAKSALDIVLSALTFPQNLSEGRLVVQTDNDIYYFAAMYAKALGLESDYKKYLDLACVGDTTIQEQHYYNDLPVDYVFFNAKAQMELGNKDKAHEIFKNMISWAESTYEDKMQKDFFAVSLPDLLVLEIDDDKVHKENCLLMKLLGALGLENKELFESTLDSLYALNPSNFKVAFYKKLGLKLMK